MLSPKKSEIWKKVQTECHEIEPYMIYVDRCERFLNSSSFFQEETK
jgi:hypothetical protein